MLDPQRLERALREAVFRRLGDATSLAVLLERHPRRRGTAALRRLLAVLGDGGAEASAGAWPGGGPTP
ncbi:MAG: hypothetical protein ACR2LY_01020 [Thermoleophilaceae bacterium]